MTIHPKDMDDIEHEHTCLVEELTRESATLNDRLLNFQNHAYLKGVARGRELAADQQAPVTAASTPVPEASKLPMQPIVWVGKVIRFKENRIVRHLLDNSTKTGCGLNELARMDFTEEERMQLAQLIGYSVSGYGELSYASQESVETADAVAEWLAARKPEASQ